MNLLFLKESYSSIVTSITGGTGYPFTNGGGNLVLSSRQFAIADTHDFNWSFKKMYFIFLLKVMVGLEF